LTIVFQNKIPKIFINRKQALVDDILMRQLSKSRPTIYSSNDFIEGQFKSVFFKQLNYLSTNLNTSPIVSTLGQADVLKVNFRTLVTLPLHDYSNITPGHSK
jgi:hypothetical protein